MSFLKEEGKSITVGLVTLLSVGALQTSSVFAAENKGDTVAEQTIDLYEGLRDDQLVMVLPEGGFIYKLDGGSDFD